MRHVLSSFGIATMFQSAEWNSVSCQMQLFQWPLPALSQETFLDFRGGIFKARCLPDAQVTL